MSEQTVECDECDGEGYYELIGLMGEMIPVKCPKCKGAGEVAFLSRLAKK